jgi:hypothetical protein
MEMLFSAKWFVNKNKATDLFLQKQYKYPLPYVVPTQENKEQKCH